MEENPPGARFAVIHLRTEAETRLLQLLLHRHGYEEPSWLDVSGQTVSPQCLQDAPAQESVRETNDHPASVVVTGHPAWPGHPQVGRFLTLPTIVTYSPVCCLPRARFSSIGLPLTCTSSSSITGSDANLHSTADSSISPSFIEEPSTRSKFDAELSTISKHGAKTGTRSSFTYGPSASSSSFGESFGSASLSLFNDGPSVSLPRAAGRSAGSSLADGLSSRSSTLALSTSQATPVLSPAASSEPPNELGECSGSGMNQWVSQSPLRPRGKKLNQTEDPSVYYTCQLCKNRILGTRVSNLQNHVRRHAAMKQFQCRHCEYAHNEIAKVKLHMTNNHKDTESQPVNNLNSNMQVVWRALFRECFPSRAQRSRGGRHKAPALMATASASSSSSTAQSSSVQQLPLVMRRRPLQTGKKSHLVMLEWIGTSTIKITDYLSHSDDDAKTGHKRRATNTNFTISADWIWSGKIRSRYWSF